MDAFNPEATTEIKVGELYQMLQQAAENAQTAKFLLNGVKNEVPYKYIREVITGEKEPDATEDPVVMNANIEIHASELAKTIKKTILDKAAGEDDEDADPCDDCVHFDDCHPWKAAGKEVTKEDEDFRPLPFPEVCKTPEEVERYHFLAGETKTDLEHIAYELGVLNGSQLSKETLLEYIITQERKAGGEA